jgi:hypothetical protein
LADSAKTGRKKIVDLRHAFGPGIPHWPGFPEETRKTIYWYAHCGMDLRAELQERVVCGGGAMGTLLLDRGVPVIIA